MCIRMSLTVWGCNHVGVHTIDNYIKLRICRYIINYSRWGLFNLILGSVFERMILYTYYLQNNMSLS